MNRTRAISLTGWTLLLLAVTVWNLSALVPGDTQQAFEVGMRHIGVMGLLSFPLGPLVWFVLVFGLGVDFETAQPEIIFNSLLCFVAGLFQWFYLVPRSIEWIKSKRVGAGSAR